jgi:hypothetical protein
VFPYNHQMVDRVLSDQTIICQPDCVRQQSKQGPAQDTPIRQERRSEMRLTNKIKEAAATGYILLWLLGIPIPILLLIFLLRGCT